MKLILINIKGNLKAQAVNWRNNWQVLVNVDSQKSLPQKKGQRFELKEQNKPRINPRHLVHYTLL